MGAVWMFIVAARARTEDSRTEIGCRPPAPTRAATRPLHVPPGRSSASRDAYESNRFARASSIPRTGHVGFAAIGGAIVLLAGCGGHASAGSAIDPTACMESQDLGRIRHEPDPPEAWLGTISGSSGSSLAIEVDRFDTVHDAARAARAATLVYVGRSGRFVVIGPARSDSPGSTLDVVSGEIASLAVSGVEACLRGSGVA